VAEGQPEVSEGTAGSPGSPASPASAAFDGHVITAAGVTRRYLRGKFTAVDNISLEVPEGQIVAFVGPSGCGKTTMLRMIAGLEEPTEGRISVYGTPVLGPGPDRGMIFQAYTSFPWLTARGNVEYGMKILGVPKEERRRKAMKLLEEVHLSKFADAYPSELSGGMKQRVAIARTLAQNPNVLLMDEPFGALDAQVRWEMQEMMIELIEVEKKTVIAVTLRSFQAGRCFTVLIRLRRRQTFSTNFRVTNRSV
jgi:NitT/TauT family transport system ATP-binding protein